MTLATTASITAGELVVDVRTMIPDPTFDPTSFVQDSPPNPDHDGAKFLASTLYTWASDAIRAVTRESGWRVEDWYSFATRNREPVYPLDQRWTVVQDAWAYQRQCYPLPEQFTVYPSQAISQPLQYGTHRRLGVLDVYYWPAPNTTDITTVTSAAIGPTDDVIQVPNTTGILSFGYLILENERIAYQLVTPAVVTPPASGPAFQPNAFQNSAFQTTGTVLPAPQPGQISILRRGVSGTVAASHAAGVSITFHSLWIKGYRNPTKVTQSTDIVEMPESCVEALKLFMRARAKGAEQDTAGERALMQEYKQEMQSFVNDPVWMSDLRDGTAQVAMYGTSPTGGLLAPYGPFGTIIP